MNFWVVFFDSHTLLLINAMSNQLKLVEDQVSFNFNNCALPNWQIRRWFLNSLNDWWISKSLWIKIWHLFCFILSMLIELELLHILTNLMKYLAAFPNVRSNIHSGKHISSKFHLDMLNSEIFMLLTCWVEYLNSKTIKYWP